MRAFGQIAFGFLLSAGLISAVPAAAAKAPPVQGADIPHLADHGTTKQLVVDGKPFLVLAGELSNSSASSLDYLATTWPTLKAAGLNTVVAPVEWDQIEPAQGKYDFTVVDGMLKQARQNNMHLVLLWFGAWKNSMSTYAPSFIKHDYATYSKAQDDKHQPQDILSPFDPDTLKADQTAFAALLTHLKQTDTAHTVIMVQVENEIGMLPVVRDYSPQAEAAFNGPVPAELIAYLKAHHDTLHPYVRGLWEAHGTKDAGTWAEVFGTTIEAQEVFQAWYFARFADQLTQAGKAAYPLPMYVNVALNRPGRAPGQYPSAGPLPHLFDVWKAAGPDIDLIAIDMYFPNYAEWADKFKRPDNPFFTPESNQAGRPDAGANAFYSFGQLDGISFSPFAIDKLTPANSGSLTQAYDVLKQLTPEILAAQGTGKMRGFRSRVSYDGIADESPQTFVLGGYRFTVNFVEPFVAKDTQTVANNGGLIIQTGDNSFIVAGQGITVTFEDADARMAVGIEQIVEGKYVDGVWKPGRWLNGDEAHQGRHLRIPAAGGFAIQKLTLYKYQ
jgi:beta-galactosidase GanA